jgi:hypothetical protein
MQYPDETLAKHLKPLEKYACNMHVYAISISTFATSRYSRCNMCNIPIHFCNISIYFCNTDTKHLQHTSETSKTPETYVCNMHFQCNISLLLGNGSRQFVEFTGVELPAPVEKNVIGPVEKATVGRSGRPQWVAMVGRRRHGEGERRAAVLGCGGDVGRREEH